MLDSRKCWIIFLLCTINAAYFYHKHRSGELKFIGMALSNFEIPSIVCFSPAAIINPAKELFNSTMIILFLCGAAHYLRRTINYLIEDRLLRLLYCEAVASAELCGCCFELIVVAEKFGVYAYLLYLFLLSIWWNLKWAEATACPYTHLEEAVQGNQEIPEVLMKIWAELTAGVFVIRLMMFLSNSDLVDSYEGRAIEKCEADLQVPLVTGAIIEAAGTFFCQLSGKIIQDLHLKKGQVVGPFIGTLAVAIAFNHTGGYYNPVLATCLKFGCKGNTIGEHLMVYWAGPCVGSLLSVLIYDRSPISNLLRKSKENMLESEPE
ncbi:UNVERIFIED_CONTAM: hypothetical protein PYX00_002695 [Menopon gallinae]|uniref:Aquaporin n=1 Tax=Menopon gallinae TaxID=328185 RepID=A0AAW2HZ20_9NEOP